MKIKTRVSALAAAISAQFLFATPSVLAQEADVKKKEDIRMLLPKMPQRAHQTSTYVV